MSVTAFPTLPSDWAPSSQCVASTAFYYIIERTYGPTGTAPGGVIYSLMYGIPTPKEYGTIKTATPSGTCVPPSFISDVPYITDSGTCPSGYSFACASQTTHSDAPASVITCCPSGAFNFECGDGDYGCTTLGSSGQTWIGTRTDLVQLTARPDTFTVGGGNYLFAWGIKLLSTSSTSTSIDSSATSTSTAASGTQTDDSEATSAGSGGTIASSTSTAAASAGLSSGARIGVGVGVGVAGALILAALGWFFLYQRRRRRARGPPPGAELQGSYNYHSGEPSPNYYDGPPRTSPDSSSHDTRKPMSPVEAFCQPSELANAQYWHPYELSETTHPRDELPATPRPNPHELPVPDSTRGG